MKTWQKVAAITLLFGVPAFLLGPVIWPPAPEVPTPTSGQLPLFLFLSVMEALTFGLGIAFLLFGRSLARRLGGGSGPLAWLVFLIIAWFLVSWWPHDNFHLHNGLELNGLLLIEYGFHFTLMLGGLVLAYAFVRVARPTSQTLEHPASSALPEPQPTT